LDFGDQDTTTTPCFYAYALHFIFLNSALEYSCSLSRFRPFMDQLKRLEHVVMFLFELILTILVHDWVLYSLPRLALGQTN
jgi:hypothetical protein